MTTETTIIAANTIPAGYFAGKAPVIVMMGVCGCGKTTVAEHLAAKLGLKSAEADDFHPQANIAKMSAGIPLTDDDRWPWLDTLAAWIDERIAAGEPAVVTCSALKKAYRDRLRRDGVVFVYMKGSFDEVLDRLSHRQGHFMKPNMLQSQFDILEEPGADEVHVDVEIGHDTTPEQECDAVIGALKRGGFAAGAGRMAMGMIGLGRMGGNMVRRLRAGGHTIVGFDMNPESGRDVDSLESLVAALPAPRVAWIMVPSGKPTDSTVERLGELLEPGDIVIDGGNSKYTEDREHAAALAEHGIGFLDCGVSGGVWGAERGYALMVGGSDETYAKVLPIFETLKPEGEYGLVHAGPVGGGHFAKMVHNGIEYGMMQAFGEGFATMMRSEYITDPARTMESWRSGSVVVSWLLDLFENATKDDPELQGVPAVANESGEARWMVEAAMELGVPTPATAAALWQRQTTRGGADDILRVVTALRAQFGGHVTKVDEIATW